MAVGMHHDIWSPGRRIDMIVITNGDAAKATLEKWVLKAEILPWRDVLHDGPVPFTSNLRSLTQIRAGFLAGCGWGEESQILDALLRRDSRLAACADHEETLLWFEHDLYDQLQLLQVLDWFSGLPDLKGPVSLICHHNFISESPPELLRHQLQSRSGVTRPQLDVGKAAWKAFRSPEPTGLLELLESDLTSLPFLKPALIRWLQEYPFVDTGLSRNEQQILSELKTGELPLNQLFQQTQRKEPVRYLGDASFERYVRLLASCSQPLVAIRPHPNARKSGSSHHPGGPLVQATEIGLAVLEGRLDHVELNGLDKWMGGVHLRQQNVWRWDGPGQSLRRN